jgi:hypothetical protein
VQPHGGRAGAAVERKGERTFGFILRAILGVGDEEDLRPRLFSLGLFLAVGGFSTIVPVVTVYLISFPPMVTA